MMITANELNKIYTNTITKYLNDGYMVNPTSFGGRQSNEICHIDLQHPKDSKSVIRVWMANYSERLKIDDEMVFGGAEAIIISVRKYNQRHNTLWLDEGEELSLIKFYIVEKDSFYTSELDDLISIIKLRNKRYSDRTIFKPSYRLLEVKSIPTNTVNSIITKIKSNYGCKKADATSIKSISLFHNSDQLRCRVEWKFNEREGVIIFK